MISDETTFPLEAYKIEDVRYIVFRFQVSTDQKVGGPVALIETRMSPNQKSILSNGSILGTNLLLLLGPKLQGEGRLPQFKWAQT